MSDNNRTSDIHRREHVKLTVDFERTVRDDSAGIIINPESDRHPQLTFLKISMFTVVC